MKGLICSVYHDDNFSDPLNVIHTKLVTLIGEGVEGPFKPCEDAPAVYLVRRMLNGRKSMYMHAQPMGDAWYMASGKFIWTSDSRFPNAYPIPLHDRVEPAR